MSQRLDRVDELLRQEIGAVLAREVADPRIGFVTITRVETARDLSRARVWASVIGAPAERTAAIRALEHAMPFVRRQLGTRIRIRRIPELHVQLDESIERGTRVLKLLADIEAGAITDPFAAAPALGSGESLPTPVRRHPQEGDTPDEPIAPGPDGYDGPPIPASPEARARKPGGPARRATSGRPPSKGSGGRPPSKGSGGTTRRKSGGAGR
jgi:ribosome-binding factor A